MSGSWDGSARIGFDLDGVIASERSVLYLLARRVQIRTLTRRAQIGASCLLRPEEGVIISCRREAERPWTENWLWSNGIKLPLLLCADVGEKAVRINSLELTHYHENQRSVAYRLSALCPRTIIRLTGEVRD